MTFISVVIPVYNDEGDLRIVLQRLGNQTISKESFEVIVVDNGSEDRSREVAREFSFVKLFEEKEYLNSPYSCRNRGIEEARGNVIALLDASCKPLLEWLENGLRCMDQSGTDMVGGNVLFDFNDNITAAKYYDSLTNIKMQKSIEKKQVAKTANLFLKRELFLKEKVGVFPEGLRSGGDVRWTKKAINEGYSLSFCENATVYKTARGFKELLRKQWRVGSHQPLIKAEQKKDVSLSKKFLKAFLPVKASSLEKMIQNNHKYPGTEDISFWKLYIVAQSVRTVMSFAFIWGTFKNRMKST